MLLPPPLSAVALLDFYFYIYGKPFPDRGPRRLQLLRGHVNAVFGLFLDEQWGLLIHAPIYLLAAAGSARSGAGGATTRWRSSPRSCRTCARRVLPRLVGRVGTARALPRPDRAAGDRAPRLLDRHDAPSVAIVITALFALPGFVIMAGFLTAPQLMYNQPDGHNALFTSWASAIRPPLAKADPLVPVLRAFARTRACHLVDRARLADRRPWSRGILGRPGCPAGGSHEPAHRFLICPARAKPPDPQCRTYRVASGRQYSPAQR